MKLHYTGDTPEWESRAPTERNLWQRWASTTLGIATPGNFFTVIGIIMVLIGLWAIAHDYLWRGIWLVGLGRFCDLIDGTVAHATHTKSPLGEVIDTSSDKIAAFATLFVFATSGIAPWELMLVIGLESLYIAYLGLTAYQRHKKPHTVAAGKIGGAALWAGLLSFALAAAVQSQTTSHTIWIAGGYICCAAGFILSAVAIPAYARAVNRT